MAFKKIRFKTFFKCAAFGLLLSFCAEDLLWAYPVPGFSVQRGKIDQGRELIVHVRDSHARLSAQYAIADILDDFSKNHGLELVALEGAAGFLDTSLLAQFPVRETRKSVAEYLLRENKISAPEYYSILFQSKTPLYGAEDENLYRQNLEVFKVLAERRASIEKELTKFRSRLQALKARIYSKELIRFTDQAELYQKGSISFADYWKTLGEFSVRTNAGRASFDELNKLDEIVGREKKIDFQKASSERQILIRRISETLPKTELEKFLLKMLEYKKDKISAAQFHAALVAAAKSCGEDLKIYPDLRDYADYLALYEAIDFPKLLEQLDILQNRIKGLLCNTADEKNLADLERAFRVLAHLFRVTLSREDYRFYRTSLQGMPLRRIGDRLERLSETYKVSHGPPADWKTLEKLLPTAESFYRLALEREKAMVENTLKRMRHDGLKFAALVSGGFHSGGISEMLEAQQVSHWVVTPRVAEGSDDERPYVSVLTQKPKEFEKLFESSDIYLSAPALFTSSLPKDERWMLLALALGANRLAGYHSLTAQEIHGYSLACAGSASFDRSMTAQEIEAVLKQSRIQVWEGQKRFAEVSLAGHDFVVPTDRRGVLQGVFLAKSVSPDRVPRIALQEKPFLENHGFEMMLRAALVKADAEFSEGPQPDAKRVELFLNETVLNEARRKNQTLSPFQIRRISRSARGFLSNVHESGPKSPSAGARLCGVRGWTIWEDSPLLRGHEGELYPRFLRESDRKVALAMSMLGSHGEGDGLQVTDPKTGLRTFIFERAVNSQGGNPWTYNRGGGRELVEKFHKRFEASVDQAQEQGYTRHHVKLSGHLRLSTSEGKQTEENTQPFHVGKGRVARKDRFYDGAWHTTEESHEALAGTNGDLIKVTLFSDGEFYSQEELGQFFSRLYGVPVGDNDSEKAAWLVYFFTTQGNWKDSLLKAYVMTQMKGPEDERPDDAQLELWAAALRAVTMQVSSDQKSVGVTEALRAELKKYFHWQSVPDEQLTRFVEKAYDSYLHSEPMRAAQEMMKIVSADSTFFMFADFTDYPDQKLFICREQPGTIARNRTKRFYIDGSKSVIIKDDLLRLSDPDDDMAVLRLLPEKDETQKGGEIFAYYSDGRERLYDMRAERELSREEIEARWELQTDNPYNTPLFSNEIEGVADSVEADARLIGGLAKHLVDKWNDPHSFSRRSIGNLIQCVTRLTDRRAKELRKEEPPRAAADLVLVSFRGMENVSKNLAKLFKWAFPLIRIEVLNANEHLHEVNDTLIDEYTVAYVIDPGETFSIARSVEDFHKARVRGEADATEESRDTQGSDPFFETLRLLQKRKLGGLFAQTNRVECDVAMALGQGFRPDSPFTGQIFTTDFAPAVDGSIAELTAHVIESTFVFLAVLEAVRSRYPKELPLGMALTQGDISRIRAVCEKTFSEKLRYVVGMEVRGGKAVPLERAEEFRNLMDYADGLIPYFLEPAKEQVATSLHLWTSIVAGLSLSAVTVWVLSLTAVSPATAFWVGVSLAAFFPVLEAVRYQWFHYFYRRTLRRKEGREPHHRGGSRTVVITDPFWNRALSMILSKRWGLSKGFTDIKIENASQLHDLDYLADRIRRGTIFVFFIPSGALAGSYVRRALAAVDKMKKIVGSFQGWGGTGALVTAIGTNGDLASMRFSRFASVHDDETEGRYPLPFDNPIAAGKILHLALDATVGLVAQGLVFSWAIPRGPAHFRSFGYDFGWRYATNMNSMHATTQDPMAAPDYSEDHPAQTESVIRALQRESEGLAETPHPTVVYKPRRQAKPKETPRSIPGNKPGRNGKMRPKTSWPKLSSLVPFWLFSFRFPFRTNGRNGQEHRVAFQAEVKRLHDRVFPGNTDVPNIGRPQDSARIQSLPRIARSMGVDTQSFLKARERYRGANGKGARLSVGVLLPPTARGREEQTRAIKSLSGLSPRIEVFPVSESVLKKGGAESVLATADLIVDADTVLLPQTKFEILSRLRRLDGDVFQVLGPFADRLIGRNVQPLTSSETGVLLRLVETGIPEAQPRELFLTAGGPAFLPEALRVSNLSRNQAESAGHLSQVLDERLSDFILARDTENRSRALSSLRELSKAFLTFLSPSGSGESDESVGSKAGAVLQKSSGFQQSRLALFDPSYQMDLSRIRAAAGTGQRTIVTDLEVFLKDGPDPYVAHMKHLEKQAPALFHHVLLVRDSRFSSPEQVTAIYPQASLFGRQMIFAPGLEYAADIASHTSPAVSLNREFIVLTAAPGQLKLGSVENHPGIDRVVLMALDRDSSSIIRFVFTGALLLLYPDQLPAFVRRLPDGSFVFELPVPAPARYLEEVRRSRQAVGRFA